MKKLILVVLVCFATIAARSQGCSLCGATNWFTAVQPGSTSIYSVPAVAGATYTWVVSGGLTILSGQGTSSVTVQVNSDGNLSVARIASNDVCANTAQIKAIQMISLNKQCDIRTASVVPIVAATSYNWYADNVFLVNTKTNTISPTSQGGLSDVTAAAQLAVRLVGLTPRTVCVEALNSVGTIISSRFCIDLQPCPLDITIDTSSSCSSPSLFVGSAFSAPSYNWYINDVLIRTTNTPSITSSGGMMIGGSITFWLSVRMRFLGQSLNTLCVEALNSSGQPFYNLLKTCVPLPSCINSSGGGGSGGGGGDSGGGGGGGGEPIMQEAIQLKIYPNPSSNELMISTSEPTNGKKAYTVKIFNSNGTEVKSVEITETNQKIYTGDLPKDNYILKVINGKKIETRRIVIE